MAVRRVDAGAQPQPGIRRPDLHVGHRRGEPARRVVLGTDRPLAVGRAPRRRAAGGRARAQRERGRGCPARARACGRPARRRAPPRTARPPPAPWRAGARAARARHPAARHGRIHRSHRRAARARPGRGLRLPRRARRDAGPRRPPYACARWWQPGLRAGCPAARFCRGAHLLPPQPRFTASCPICSKGTVLDPDLKPSRPRRTSSDPRRRHAPER